jgi:MFS family permease
MGVYPAALIAYYYDQTGKLGRFTGFGSLGWGIGSILAGIVAAGWLFPVAAAVLSVTTMVALLGLKSQHVRLDQRFFDARVVKRNWRLYLSFYLRHTGAFSIWAVFPLLIADLGASRFWVGVIFALNPLSQVPFMNLLERFQSRTLIRVGLVLSAAVFACYALAPNHWWLIPIQVALGLSWAYLYLGSMKRLMERNPERSTAAGMFQSLFGLSAVSGSLLSGITGAFGYKVVVLVAAAFAVAGTLVFWNAPDDG